MIPFSKVFLFCEGVFIVKFQQIRSATSIVTFGGKRFLIDPMLSDQGSYPSVPETADTGRGNPDCSLPCSVEDLFQVDAVIVTHLHFDHFDEAAARLLPKQLPVFSQSEEEARILSGYGFADVRVLLKEGTEFEGVRLFRTECDHGSSNYVTMRGYEVMGLSEKACGVVFESPLEKMNFYLAGDTVFCGLVVETIERFHPGVVAVNAGGAQFPLGHLLIMNQYDVCSLMQRFPDLDVIATHVEGVSHATVNRPMLRDFAVSHKLERLRVPDDGQEFSFV